MHMLFTRVPLPGAVKTRLAPILAPDQRASLQEALIVDTLIKLLELDGNVTLYCSDEQRLVSDGLQLYEAFIKRVYDACDCLDADSRLVTKQQKGVDLGERMSNALEDAFEEGADACLLMGSDLPYITPTDVAAAGHLLESADVVFGPSPDGGYWLVGMKSPFPELFANKQYGQADVLEHALEICRRHGKTIAFAPSSSDVDTPRDCELLHDRVSSGDIRIGPYTKQIVERLFGDMTE